MKKLNSWLKFKIMEGISLIFSGVFSGIFITAISFRDPREILKWVVFILALQFSIFVGMIELWG